ncbi:MAG TPA: cytochrome d ubiquinol oxidase subunit II [Puia sp.]|nr:cytochrome d ubiquinol oxidase subunit II [Puia sp.]
MATFLGLDYNIWWFLVFGGVISGYAILDGFDLGAGCLHLFLRQNTSRRMAMYAVGPIWDGNEVWLVIGGGVLFAGFPTAYAAIFSAFYMPFMVFLVGLIFRGIAIEIRDKEPGYLWQRNWDIIYCIASWIITLSLGLMLGNVVEGIPLNHDHEFAGDWLTFFNPFSILVALTTLGLFTMHGALYLMMKTQGQLFEKLNKLTISFMIYFMVLLALTTVYTLLYLPYLSAAISKHPAYFIIPALLILAIANIPRELKRWHFRSAFLCSAAVIALLLILVAMDVFPNLVFSPGSTGNSITVYNGSSSLKALRILLVIALIGVPLILVHTTFVFWTFKGKVKEGELSE